MLLTQILNIVILSLLFLPSLVALYTMQKHGWEISRRLGWIVSFIVIPFVAPLVFMGLHWSEIHRAPRKRKRSY